MVAACEQVKLAWVVPAAPWACSEGVQTKLPGRTHDDIQHSLITCF